MGIAKLYGQKASGTNINGIIKDYHAYAGENISAGDLVEYINGIASSRTETSIDTQLTTETYTSVTISAVQLDESRVFIAHSHTSGSYYLYGVVCTIDGVNITAGVDTVLSSASYSGNKISAVLLPSGNVFIAHTYSKDNLYIYGMVVTINGTDITAGTDTKLSTAGGALFVSAIALPNGNVFIVRSYGTNKYCYGMICTISGTTITKGTDTDIYSIYCDNASLKLLPNGNVFIAYSYHQSYEYLYGVVCTVSGTSFTVGTEKAIVSVQYVARTTSITLLDESRVFIAHRYSSSSQLYGVVCTISGTTITAGTDTALNTTGYTGYKIATVLIDNNKVFLAHSHTTNTAYLYAMICTISDTTITVGTDTVLSNVQYTGYDISMFLLQNGTIFIAHPYSTSYYLYAQIWGVSNNIPTNQIVINKYETQVRKTTTSQFDGVAKTSGVGGDETGHKDLVSIYTL